MAYAHQWARLTPFGISTLATVLLLLLMQTNLAEKYLSNSELFTRMRELEQKHPDRTHVYSIGQSVNGEELLVIAVSAQNASQHVLLRPEVKYIGNMHGNEAVSRETLIRFVDHLLEHYGIDSNVTQLMDSARIHIMPTMNPDGFASSFEGNCSGNIGRWNANGIDLNRNFPDVFHSNWPDEPKQPEVEAIISWMKDHKFTLSANFHGGSVVANYPYDSVPAEPSNYTYSKTPDDDTFQFLARRYSFAHRNMRNNACDNFKDGITNGAEWYIAIGVMQDYNYAFEGCMEITVEMSCCKFPRAATLPEFWLDNRDAMMAYLANINLGVRGVISYEDGEPVHGAKVQVDSRMHVSTTELGEYWKIVLPGVYNLSVYLERSQVFQSIITVPAEDPLVFNINISRKAVQSQLQSRCALVYTTSWYFIMTLVLQRLL